MTEHTPEARLRQHPDGTFYASDGSHGRLELQDPLHLSNTFLLYNRAVLGDDVANDAFSRRVEAYHEAGHLWAARRMDLDVAPTRLGTPSSALGAPTEGGELLLRASGPLATAVAMEADTCEMLDIETGYGPGFGPRMLPSPRIDDVKGPPPARQERRSTTYRRYALPWVEQSCGRGGDLSAAAAIGDIAWLATTCRSCSGSGTESTGWRACYWPGRRSPVATSTRSCAQSTSPAEGPDRDHRSLEAVSV